MGALRAHRDAVFLATTALRHEALAFAFALAALALPIVIFHWDLVGEPASIPIVHRHSGLPDGSGGSAFPVGPQVSRTGGEVVIVAAPIVASSFARSSTSTTNVAAISEMGEIV